MKIYVIIVNHVNYPVLFITPVRFGRIEAVFIFTVIR